MKTNLSFLPSSKQTEFARIVAIITETKLAEMIVLFGSYARNDWVEHKYDDTHFRYQSDMDILIIVETKSDSVQEKLERDIECKIDQDDQIKTPVSIIVHDIDFLNKRLRKAQYFFADIKKEGILLYDSRKFHLQEARELSALERKQLAQDDFDYYFAKAKSFKSGVEFYLTRGSLNEAAFLLHQVTERLFSGILLVFTRYKPERSSVF